MNREEFLKSSEFEMLKQKYNSSRFALRLGTVDFPKWLRVQSQVANSILQMTDGKISMEDVMSELTNYIPPKPVKSESYSELNWKWKDVQVGDKFTTEGLRGFCSGGDSFDDWEEVVKIDGEKIYLKGFKNKSDWWSAIWGDHNTQYYTLCRHKSK